MAYSKHSIFVNPSYSTRSKFQQSDFYVSFLTFFFYVSFLSFHFTAAKTDCQVDMCAYTYLSLSFSWLLCFLMWHFGELINVNHLNALETNFYFVHSHNLQSENAQLICPKCKSVYIIFEFIVMMCSEKEGHLGYRCMCGWWICCGFHFTMTGETVHLGNFRTATHSDENSIVFCSCCRPHTLRGQTCSLNTDAPASGSHMDLLNTLRQCTHEEPSMKPFHSTNRSLQWETNVLQIIKIFTLRDKKKYYFRNCSLKCYLWDQKWIFMKPPSIVTGLLLIAYVRNESLFHHVKFSQHL